MGLRGNRQQIAKARLAIMGAGNINRKFSLKNADGIPNWKTVLYGKTGESAHKAQMNHGRLVKAKAEAKKTFAKRKVKRVTE